MAEEPKYLSADQAPRTVVKDSRTTRRDGAEIPRGNPRVCRIRKGISRRIGGVRARWLIEYSTTAALFSSGIPLPCRA